MSGPVCEHGSLLCVCLVCELEARIAEAESTIGALKHLIGEQTDRIAELTMMYADEGSLRLSHEGHIEKLDARIAELEADVVWAARHAVRMWGGHVEWVRPESGYTLNALACDGTPADILRAVREARR